MLGHCGSNRLEKNERIHGFNLIGKFEIREECADRQKNIKTEWKGGSEVQREKLYIDIGSVRDASYGGSKIWILITDNHTDNFWNIFLKNEDDLKDKMITLLNDLKIAGMGVKHICGDDSGENDAFYNA